MLDTEIEICREFLKKEAERAKKYREADDTDIDKKKRKIRKCLQTLHDEDFATECEEIISARILELQQERGEQKEEENNHEDESSMYYDSATPPVIISASSGSTPADEGKGTTVPQGGESSSWFAPLTTSLRNIFW